MYNHVTVCGRLTHNPELHTSASAVSYVRFTLAVNNPYSQTQNTVFVSAIAWRNNAINMAKFLKRGSLVLLDGRLQNTSGSFLELSVNSVYFMESKKTTQNFNTPPKPSTSVESTVTPTTSTSQPTKTNITTEAATDHTHSESSRPENKNENKTTNLKPNTEEGIDWDNI